MTEIQESYGTSARTTYVGAGADGSTVDWMVRCTNCGEYFASATLVGGGAATVRGKCRRCGHAFTARSDRSRRR